MGTLTTITGCMFSGKTTDLLRRLESAGDCNVAAFKHAIDDRYQTHLIVTHGGKALAATSVDCARDIEAALPAGANIIGIDEAHFFDAGLFSVVGELVRAGKHVLVTALSTDSWGKPFPVVDRLVEMASESVSLTATCARCGDIATRTQRRTPIVNGDMVGGAESYEPRCRTCWAPPPAPRSADSHAAPLAGSHAAT